MRTPTPRPIPGSLNQPFLTTPEPGHSTCFPSLCLPDLVFKAQLRPHCPLKASRASTLLCPSSRLRATDVLTNFLSAHFSYPLATMVCGEAMARKCQMHFTRVILFSFHRWGKTLLGEGYSHFTDKDSGPEGGWVTSLRLQSPVGSEQPRGLPQIKGIVAQTLSVSGVWKRKPRKPWFRQPGSGFCGHSAIRCWARRCSHSHSHGHPSLSPGTEGCLGPTATGSSGSALLQQCDFSELTGGGLVSLAQPVHGRTSPVD